MGGPYDIYGNQQSATSRLPLGLGSDSALTSMWPDFLLMGGGSLVQRHALRASQGRGLFSGKGGLFNGFGLGYTDQEMSVVKRLNKVPTSSIPKYKSQLAGILKSSRGAARVPTGSHISWGTPAFSSTGTLDIPADMTTRSAVPSRTGTMSRVDSPLMKRSAVKWHVGNVFKGLGTSLAIMQLTAGMIDIGRAAGEAYIDWKPRRGSSRPTDFNKGYYDPSGAFTQRQRAIQAIHNSQLTTRAAIGSEAAYMHQ